MQVNPQEVSGEKATTPATDLRLVSVEQLQKIHRELDACQKVIWLAGCRPRVPNGFDPAYVTGAQEQLKVIEALIAEQQNADEALEPCGECIEGLQMIDPYDGGTFVTCKRCNGRGVVAVCPACRQGVPADSAHLVAAESTIPSFLATLKEAKVTAMDVFAGCHDDAKQAIEYMAALLEVSDLAKQGGAA
ncbi:hypothetical protein ACM7HL_12880 [Pseudomonas aeruginosa]